jgi:hypothetical protein
MRGTLSTTIAPSPSDHDTKSNILSGLHCISCLPRSADIHPDWTVPDPEMADTRPPLAQYVFISCRVMAAYTHSFESLRNPISICSGKTTRPTRAKDSICSKSDAIPRLRDPLRSIRLREHASLHRANIFLKRSIFTVSALPHAKARHLHKPNSVD